MKAIAIFLPMLLALYTSTFARACSIPQSSTRPAPAQPSAAANTCAGGMCRIPPAYLKQKPLSGVQHVVRTGQNNQLSEVYEQKPRGYSWTY